MIISASVTTFSVSTSLPSFQNSKLSAHQIDILLESPGVIGPINSIIMGGYTG